MVFVDLSVYSPAEEKRVFRKYSNFTVTIIYGAIASLAAVDGNDSIIFGKSSNKIGAMLDDLRFWQSRWRRRD